MLNYSVKALECLDAIRGHLPVSMETDVMGWAIEQLERSVKFHLPDDGLVFGADAEISYPDLMRGQRLPFPCMAIEFALTQGAYPIYEEAPIPCYRRLAVAVDLMVPAELDRARSAFGPGLDFALERCELDRSSPAACLVLNLDHSSLDQPHVEHLPRRFASLGEMWVPAWAGVVVPYDQRLRETPPRQLPAQRITNGRYERRSIIAMEPVLYGTQGIAAMQSATDFVSILDRMGEFVVEAGTLLSLVIALGCRNIRSVTRLAPEKLQKARRKRGQRPLFDYHELMIEPPTAGSAKGSASGGANRASPATHLRRGHVRRLAGDDWTWIPNAVVNPGAANGARFKDYKLG